MLLRIVPKDVFSSQNSTHFVWKQLTILLDPHLEQQMRTAAEPLIVKKLFSLYLNAHQQVQQQAFQQSESNGLVQLCGLYIQLQTYWKPVQTQLLNSLTYSTNIVKNLWKLIISAQETEKLANTACMPLFHHFGNGSIRC